MYHHTHTHTHPSVLPRALEYSQFSKTSQKIPAAGLELPLTSCVTAGLALLQMVPCSFPLQGRRVCVLVILSFFTANICRKNQHVKRGLGDIVLTPQGLLSRQSGPSAFMQPGVLASWCFSPERDGKHNLLLLYFFPNIYLLFLLTRQIYKEARQRKIFYLLTYPPNGYKGQG